MSICGKIFRQSAVISVSILLVNGVNAVIQHFLGNDITLSWYHPIIIVLVGVVCALPTLFLRDIGSCSRRSFMIRVVLHFLTLYAAVIGAGYLLGMCAGSGGLIAVSTVFFITYAIVWLTEYLIDRQNAKKINLALSAIRDEE